MIKNIYKEYNEYKTKWLIDNGYTINDIITYLEDSYKHQKENPRYSFARFEKYGFKTYGSENKIYMSFNEWYEKTQENNESKTQKKKEKKIPLALIKDLGFEIIEVTCNCDKLRPINLDTIKGGFLLDFRRNNYIIEPNRNFFDDFNSEIKFTITRNGNIIKPKITIEEVKEYFNDYFEKHPEQLQQMTIADVLELEHIEIEENTHNVLEYGEINIYDLTNKIDDESFEFSPSCGYDIPSLDSDYDYATVDFTVYKDGQKILDCVPEKDVDKFIKKLIKKYR